MRKYYYLKSLNTWSRSLTIFELIGLVLCRQVKAFTTVWHTGLCDAGLKHPQGCIHPSIKAVEIKAIPGCLFKDWYGFLELLRIFKSLAHKIYKSNNSLEKVLEWPELLEGAKLKKLIPSIRAINDFSSGGEYEVDLTYRALGDDDNFITKTYSARLKEVKPNYFEFQIMMQERPAVGGIMYQESYGLNNELIFKNSITSLRVLQNSVIEFSTKPAYVPQVLRGRFTQMNQIVNSNYNNVFIRLIIPCNVRNFKAPISVVERDGDIVFDEERFNVFESEFGLKFRTGTGYIDLFINGKNFHVYSINKSFTVIESIARIDLNEFKSVSNQIRLALAFLSGSFYRGETYYLSSHSEDFSKIEGVWYEKELGEIDTNNQLINPTFISQTSRSIIDSEEIESKKLRVIFSSQLFSTLCGLMLTEDELQRTIQLLVNGSSNSDPVQKGALYSVAIETITTMLVGKNEEKVKPITDKEVSKSLIKRMVDLISEYSDSISENGVKIIKSKIENINSPTNRDQLTKPFEIYGFNLSKKDLEAIDRRNHYLHGRSPLNKTESFELERLALELHFLVSCLILKYIGYNGYVINLPIFLIINNEKEFKKLSASKHYEEYLLYKELTNSLEEQNEKKFNDVKQQLQVFYSTHEITNLVKLV